MKNVQSKLMRFFLFCLLINPPSNCTKLTLRAHRNVERRGLCTEYVKKNGVDPMDGMKKTAAKRLCVTNQTRLLLARFCRDLHIKLRLGMICQSSRFSDEKCFQDTAVFQLYARADGRKWTRYAQICTIRRIVQI